MMSNPDAERDHSNLSVTDDHVINDQYPPPVNKQPSLDQSSCEPCNDNTLPDMPTEEHQSISTELPRTTTEVDESQPVNEMPSPDQSSCEPGHRKRPRRRRRPNKRNKFLCNSDAVPSDSQIEDQHDYNYDESTSSTTKNTTQRVIFDEDGNVQSVIELEPQFKLLNESKRKTGKRARTFNLKSWLHTSSQSQSRSRSQLDISSCGSGDKGQTIILSQQQPGCNDSDNVTAAENNKQIYHYADFTVEYDNLDGRSQLTNVMYRFKMDYDTMVKYWYYNLDQLEKFGPPPPPNYPIESEPVASDTQSDTHSIDQQLGEEKLDVAQDCETELQEQPSHNIQGQTDINDDIAVVTDTSG